MSEIEEHTYSPKRIYDGSGKRIWRGSKQDFVNWMAIAEAKGWCDTRRMENGFSFLSSAEPEFNNVSRRALKSKMKSNDPDYLGLLDALKTSAKKEI